MDLYECFVKCSADGILSPIEMRKMLDMDCGIIRLDRNVEVQRIEPYKTTTDDNLIPRLCTCCGAALSARSNTCEYCGVSYGKMSAEQEISYMSNNIEILRFKQERLVRQESTQKLYEEAIRAMQSYKGEI